MTRTLIALLTLAAVWSPQNNVSTPELLRMARARDARLEQALRDTFTPDNIQKGTAALGERGDFVWAVAAEKGPSLQINNEPPIAAFSREFCWFPGGAQRARTA